jgi:hypothetical protein
MQFKDTFKDYKKNSSLKNLEKTHKESDYKPHEPVMKTKTLKKNHKILGLGLGYYFPPEIIKTVENYLPKTKKEEINQFNLDNYKMVSSVYHVIVSFKYASVDMEELKIFLQKIKDHSKDKIARIIFYIVDNTCSRQAYNLTKEEQIFLEGLLVKMQQCKFIFRNIEKKNMQFNKINNYFNKTIQTMTQFLQKISSTSALDLMELTTDIVGPAHFLTFLKKFGQENNMLLKIIHNTRFDGIKKLLAKENTNNIIYLNVKNMFQFYNREFLDYTLEDICVSNNLEFLDSLFKKEKNNDNIKKGIFNILDNKHANKKNDDN